MGLRETVRGWFDRLSESTVCVGVCALGRALDFATTWVALEQGRAAEAKPVAAQIFGLLGHQGGMIAYETAITTPAIFLGCYLVQRAYRSRPRDEAAELARVNAGRWFFVLIGVISLGAALHNARFLV